MPSGSQCFDTAGNITFDTSDQTIKFLGSAIIGSGGTNTATGTITDSRFTAYANHEPFWFEIEGGNGIAYTLAPLWTISGNNLSWSYPYPGTRPTTRIIYGIAGVT